jgi:hypothetical protein
MLKFNQFERAKDLLEKFTIEEIKENGDILDSVGLDESILPELEKLNEGFIGGLFDKLKNALSKRIPGGILKRAETQLKSYKDTMEQALEQEIKLRKDVLGEKGGAEADEKRRAQFDKQMDRVTAKVDNYKESAENEFNKMTRGQPDRVRDYINMRLAEIKADIAKLELESAQKNAELYTEKEQTKIKSSIKDAEAAAQAETKKAEESMKDGKDKKDKKEVKKGETWDREITEGPNKGKTQTVEALEDSDEKGNVQVKIAGTQKKIAVNTSSFTKKGGDDKKDKGGDKKGILGKIGDEVTKKYEPPVKQAA